ncbi:MAG TPA: transglycosylase domain-containing protein, partial [bacterium]|nr:transglycosylase domain-containing protein [bacterium]
MKNSGDPVATKDLSRARCSSPCLSGKGCQQEGARPSRRRRILIAATVIPALCVASLCLLFSSVSVVPDDLRISDDLILTDRDGRVLRHVPGLREERHLWTNLAEVPPLLRQAFLAAEDRRFFEHHGVDPRAMLRAFLSNCRSRRIVSGASTITQQLVRITYPRQRTYAAKLVEIVRAIKVERRLKKETLLEYYLNRVPMGNNIVGVGLASQVYFGRTPEHLDAASCALLASLPKAPATLNPYGKDTERLKTRRNWILGRMLQQGWLSKEEHDRAVLREIEVRPKSFAFNAPHFVDWVIAKSAQSKESALFGVHRTTLDLEMQRNLEKVLASHQQRLLANGCRQAGAIIVHNPTMEVLALSGSLNYSQKDGGFNNVVTAMRCPGSTLKPFLYAHALDSGFTVSTLLGDTERGYRSPTGSYFPRNFDRYEYGPVTLRTALGSSLNLSSVQMLQMVGQDSFFE